jgi:hypothetical protein
MLSLISNWTLLPGLSAQIRFAGEEVCAGIIDCVTPDGEILWIDSGAGMRRLVEKPFGYEAWLDTDDEAILYKISHQGQDDSQPSDAQGPTRRTELRGCLHDAACKASLCGDTPDAGVVELFVAA